jgi:hypothetical protein
MRVLGDIDPRSSSVYDSSVTANRTQRSEALERLDHGERYVSDVPLRITDERYRLECERLREDEAWREMEVRGESTPQVATAIGELEIPRVSDRGNPLDEGPIDLGFISNELVQEQRLRAASGLASSLGCEKQSSRRKPGAPWSVVLILVLALAVLAGYSYLAMRQNGVSAWRLPGVATAITVHRRLEAAQSRARADLQAARERSDLLVAAGRERWARWRR